MLLVIFGAGASWDSVPDRPVSDRSNPYAHSYRPPLAKDLFDHNRPNFGEVLLRYGEAIPLVMELERRVTVPDGPALEQELERFQEEADTTYPPRHRQLTAVRFYLQRILWDCSVEWQKENYGKNNYVGLLSRLDKWRHSENERIAIVTFNYDTLLDKAFASVFRPLTSLASYVAEDVGLFKVHGSVNWGRPIQGKRWPRFSGVDNTPTGLAKADRIRRRTISEIQSLTIDDASVVLTKELLPVTTDGIALYPALAIPFASKLAFDCPSGHLGLLEKLLSSVDRILVVGWRGNEQPFLKLLGLIEAKAPRILVVGWKAAGVLETASYLESAGLSPANMHKDERGFSTFLQDDSLEEFLKSPIQE